MWICSRGAASDVPVSLGGMASAGVGWQQFKHGSFLLWAPLFGGVNCAGGYCYPPPFLLFFYGFMDLRCFKIPLFTGSLCLRLIPANTSVPLATPEDSRLGDVRPDEIAETRQKSPCKTNKHPREKRSRTRRERCGAKERGQRRARGLCEGQRVAHPIAAPDLSLQCSAPVFSRFAERLRREIPLSVVGEPQEHGTRMSRD